MQSTPYIYQGERDWNDQSVYLDQAVYRDVESINIHPNADCSNKGCQKVKCWRFLAQKCDRSRHYVGCSLNAGFTRENRGLMRSNILKSNAQAALEDPHSVFISTVDFVSR